MRRAWVILVAATLGAVALGSALEGQQGKPAVPMRGEKVKEDLDVLRGFAGPAGSGSKEQDPAYVLQFRNWH